MKKSYRDIFPEPPLLDSDDIVRSSAASLMSFEHFIASPGSIPAAVYDEHHIPINLTPSIVRVENERDGVIHILLKVSFPSQPWRLTAHNYS